MGKRTVLFAMTGAGNNAFKALRNHPDVELIGVFTPPKKNTPYPYYKCEHLQDVVVRNGISLYEGRVLADCSTQTLLASLRLDVIVVSTFSQIIPQTLIALPKYGVVNVHPSLLPKYRGATPTVCALLNGELETGVTVHFISDETIDSGRIIAQVRVAIDPSDTDGHLRFKLARLSEQILPEALSKVFSQDRSAFPEQIDGDATYCPKRGSIKPELDLRSMPLQEIVNTIRAMTPFPGAVVNYMGKRYVVTDAALCGGQDVFLKHQSNDQTLVVNTREGMVEFRVTRMNKHD